MSRWEAPEQKRTLASELLQQWCCQSGAAVLLGARPAQCKGRDRAAHRFSLRLARLGGLGRVIRNSSKHISRDHPLSPSRQAISETPGTLSACSSMSTSQSHAAAHLQVLLSACWGRRRAIGVLQGAPLLA